MSKEKDKMLSRSKPTIWYYLLALFFPIMFFLLDDSDKVFENWTFQNKEWIWKLLGLFIFWGTPILLLILRREIKIYADKLEVKRPGIKSFSTYYFSDMQKWNVSEVAVYGISQTNLYLKFKRKRFTFNKIELTAFKELMQLLEENYIDKKH